MKKKIFAWITALFACASLAGCTGGGNTDDTSNEDKGAVISSAEAKELFAGIEEKSEQITVETLDKFSYTLVSQMDEATMTSYHRFSKQDRYIYYNSTVRNMDLYNGYEDEYKVYLGTTHLSQNATYYYVDGEGRLVSAYSSFHDRTTKTEGFERKQDSQKRYRFEAETEEESITAFHNSSFTQVSDLMAQLLSYSSQMAQTFEPLLEMGNTSLGGIYNVEIRSKGAGHLWIKEDMPSMGIYMECEYVDYMLSYMKSVTDNTKTGMSALDCKVMTTEMSFVYNECELVYPDLTQYKFYS